MNYEIVWKVKRALASLDKPLPASRIARKAGVTVMQAAHALRQIGALRELNVKKGIFYYEPSLRVTGSPYEIEKLVNATALPKKEVSESEVTVSLPKGSVLILSPSGHYIPAKSLVFYFSEAE